METICDARHACNSIARFTSHSSAATLFSNSGLRRHLQHLQRLRLFTPIGSNITEALFFVPDTSGAIPQRSTRFGAVFTDVDEPGGTNLAKTQTLRPACCFKQAVVQQFRPRLSGRWEPFFLRHHV